MNKKASLLLFIVLFSCKNFDNTFSKINELYDQKKYEEVIKTYAGKEEYRKDARIANKIGMAYHNLGLFEKAISCYDEAIKLEKTESVFYSNKALSEIEIGEYISASVSCEKAIELDDENFRAYVNSSYAFIKLKQWDWALKDLNKAISIRGVEEKEMAVAYANLGTIYLNKNEDKKALEYSNLAIEKNNEISWAYKNRAYLNMKAQQIDAAMRDINHGLHLKPKDEILLYYKGLILAKKGNKKEGCELIIESLSLIEKKDQETYVMISNVFEKYCKE